jgi:hypothetical protein
MDLKTKLMISYLEGEGRTNMNITGLQPRNRTRNEAAFLL